MSITSPRFASARASDCFWLLVSALPLVDDLCGRCGTLARARGAAPGTRSGPPSAAPRCAPRARAGAAGRPRSPSAATAAERGLELVARLAGVDAERVHGVAEALAAVAAARLDGLERALLGHALRAELADLVDQRLHLDEQASEVGGSAVRDTLAPASDRTRPCACTQRSMATGGSVSAGRASSRCLVDGLGRNAARRGRRRSPAGRLCTRWASTGRSLGSLASSSITKSFERLGTATGSWVLRRRRRLLHVLDEEGRDVAGVERQARR